MIIKEFLRDSTLKITWIDSGTTPNSIHFNILDKSESILSSDNMVSSGNGHYFALFTIPNSFNFGFYNSETVAVIDNYPYRKKRPFRVIPGEV